MAVWRWAPRSLAAAAVGGRPRIDLDGSTSVLRYGRGRDRSGAAGGRFHGRTTAGHLPARVADLLADGQIVMWFQGRMEYGPRALGHRSVLARPDRPDLRDRLNLVLKRRVWYQPFCPSMLDSEAPRLLADWTAARNRAMTMAYAVSPCFATALAGVISIDGTCRPQFVPTTTRPVRGAAARSAARWGVGAVLNTSFNIHGEPLVCSPAEAIDVFLRSGADALAIGPFLVERPA